jgi:hypothetical protein
VAGRTIRQQCKGKGKGKGKGEGKDKGKSKVKNKEKFKGNDKGKLHPRTGYLGKVGVTKGGCWKLLPGRITR